MHHTIIVVETLSWFGSGWVEQMNLTAFQWVAATILTLMAIGGVILLPRIWRGELASLYDKNSKDIWLWGESIRRGFIRGLHWGIVGTVALVIIFFTLPGPGHAPELSTATTIAIILFFLSLALNVLVILLNRPKWAVPPHYRSQSGAIKEWLAKSKKHRQ